VTCHMACDPLFWILDLDLDLDTCEWRLVVELVPLGDRGETMALIVVWRLAACWFVPDDRCDLSPDDALAELGGYGCGWTILWCLWCRASGTKFIGDMGCAWFESWARSSWLGGPHAECEWISSPEVLLFGMSERGSSFHARTWECYEWKSS